MAKLQRKFFFYWQGVQKKNGLIADRISDRFDMKIMSILYDLLQFKVHSIMNVLYTLIFGGKS
jgi:hypothetical protein